MLEVSVGLHQHFKHDSGDLCNEVERQSEGISYLTTVVGGLSRHNA